MQQDMSKINTFVMADIHGGYKALLQCLERSGFDYEKDILIQSGDVADGWSEVYECVEELLKIKNLIAIKGNHDHWTLQWMNTGIHPGRPQGGDATIYSYLKNCGSAENWENATYIKVPESHLKFFRTQHLYYIDDQNRLFIHAGFNRHYSIKDQRDEKIYYWDRDFWASALSHESISKTEHYKGGQFKIKDNFKEVFIGHTSTTNWSVNEVKVNGIVIPGNRYIDFPMKAANVYNLDTGAGFNGKLTIMNVDTKQYWQSDLLKDLYPNEKGRN